MVDLDEACRLGKRARANTLDQILMRYVRTCVN